MTLGIAFLILFLPIIAVFIANNFEIVTGYFTAALQNIQTVPQTANSLWSLLPGTVTVFIISLIVISLSASLIKRIVGGV